MYGTDRVYAPHTTSVRLRSRASVGGSRSASTSCSDDTHEAKGESSVSRPRSLSYELRRRATLSRFRRRAMSCSVCVPYSGPGRRLANVAKQLSAVARQRRFEFAHQLFVLLAARCDPLQPLSERELCGDHSDRSPGAEEQERLPFRHHSRVQHSNGGFGRSRQCAGALPTHVLHRRYRVPRHSIRARSPAEREHCRQHRLVHPSQPARHRAHSSYRLAARAGSTDAAHDVAGIGPPRSGSYFYGCPLTLRPMFYGHTVTNDLQGGADRSESAAVKDRSPSREAEGLAPSWALLHVDDRAVAVRHHVVALVSEAVGI